MSIQAELNAYLAELQEEANYEKALTDARIRVKYREKRLDVMAKLAVSGQSESLSETESFIAKHREKLEQHDLDFLAEEYRGTSEVARYLEVSSQTIKRRGDDGTIEFKSASGSHRRYKTVSVVRYLLNAETEEEI